MIARTIVIAVRVILPLSIFRWPLVGGIASMIVDALDVILVDIIANLIGEEPGFGSNYQEIDKPLDLYYLTFEFIVSLRWATLARNTSIALFALRVVGMIAFTLTGARILLFIFPNLFENWYLYYLITVRWYPRLVPANARQLAIVLVALYIPKIAQEYVLHFAEFKPWSTFKDTFLALRVR